MGRHFDGYVIFDIYSRYMVGARVHTHESGFLAVELVEKIFAVRGIPNLADADHETWMTSNTRRGDRRGS